MAGNVTASIAAQNTFSDAIYIGPGRGLLFSLTGTWAATVFMQRAYGDASLSPSDWRDVNSFVSNGERQDVEPVGAWYRFGVKTGGYTSGTVAGRIEAHA